MNILALDMAQLTGWSYISNGKIIESGPAAEFFRTPKTRQAIALLKGDIVE